MLLTMFFQLAVKKTDKRQKIELKKIEGRLNWIKAKNLIFDSFWDGEEKGNSVLEVFRSRRGWRAVNASNSCPNNEIKNQTTQPQKSIGSFCSRFFILLLRWRLWSATTLRAKKLERADTKQIYCWTQSTRVFKNLFSIESVLNFSVLRRAHRLLVSFERCVSTAVRFLGKRNLRKTRCSSTLEFLASRYRALGFACRHAS